MTKRQALGDVAETFAAKRVTGDASNADFLELLRYYPDDDPAEFRNAWCCAFVYYCCRAAGFALPPGTHRTARIYQWRRFTSAIAWVEWAHVCGFLHGEGSGFVPERGDIVIYHNLIPEAYKHEDDLWCDHAGVVLSCDGDTLTVAEGNVDNQNVSGIVERKRSAAVDCYIRIPEDADFSEPTVFVRGWARLLEVVGLRKPVPAARTGKERLNS